MTKHLPEAERRSQILDAARRCFIERGFAGTRMQDIARGAGLSKGGIYFHFSSKRELFDALVRQEYDLGRRFLEQVSESAASWRQLLQELAGHFLEFFLRRPDYPRFFMVMAEMAGRDESVRRMLVELQHSYFATLEDLIRRGVAAGQLRPVDARSAALLLKGLLDAMEGYLAIGIEFEPSRLVETAVEVLSSGLQNQEAGK